MIRRYLKIIAMAGLGAIVLFHYQNCSSPQSLQNFSESDERNGSVRVIEDWEQSKVSFVEGFVELAPDSQNLKIEGLCSRQIRDRLDWQLSSEDENGMEIERGETSCEGGGFILDLLDVRSLRCDSLYSLRVTHFEGDSSLMQIKKRCQPLSSIAVESSGSNDQNCFLERNMVADLGHQCQKVCYAEGRVYFEQEVEIQLCGNG